VAAAAGGAGATQLIQRIEVMGNLQIFLQFNQNRIISEKNVTAKLTEMN